LDEDLDEVEKSDTEIATDNPLKERERSSFNRGKRRRGRGLEIFY